jgi:hypothetical protein
MNIGILQALMLNVIIYNRLRFDRHCLEAELELDTSGDSLCPVSAV